MQRLAFVFLAAGLFAAAAGAASASTPAAASAPIPVPPGKLFNGAVLDIRAPTSDGWALSTATPGTWAFVRTGPAANETWAATITGFQASATLTPAQFAQKVQDASAKDLSSDRFVKHASIWEIDSSRGYACVRNRAAWDDRQSALRSGGRATQLLQVWSLYCHHPQRQELGFVIMFSHRGGAPDARIDQEGADFAAGIQVPAAKPAAASAPN